MCGINEYYQEIKEYNSFKNMLDFEIKEVAAGFIRIGYLLKVARDTDILRDSGYTTVADFARVEYGLTKDVVSRYIAINDRYSKEGYSDILQDKYKEFGVAKLAEMLTLPDSVIETLSPSLTKREIIEVKKEVQQEEQITDIEVMLENKDESSECQNSLEMFLHSYFKDNKQEYVKLWDKLNERPENYTDEIINIMAPVGVIVKTTRIKGIGKLLLSIKGKNENIQICNVRTGEIEEYTWLDIIERLNEILLPLATPFMAWDKLYAAPVQLDQTEETSVTNEPEIIEPEVVEPKINEHKEPCLTAADVENIRFKNEQLENVTESAEIVEEPEEISEEENFRQKRKAHLKHETKVKLLNSAQNIEAFIANENWEAVRKVTENILIHLNRIEALEEE